MNGPQFHKNRREGLSLGWVMLAVLFACPILFALVWPWLCHWWGG